MLRKQHNCVLGLLIISACASPVSAGPIAGASITGGQDLPFCELAKLLPDDAVGGDGFGNSVSVSGDVGMVGADNDADNGSGSGSAYAFRWNGTAWVQEQKLLPDDGVAYGRFGISVSVSGDVAVIGASGHRDNGDVSGSAYVFRWNGSDWVQEQKILPDDGAAGDEFGFSVSIFGDVALVGAYHDNDNGSSSGAAYVFRWNGTDWVHEQKLLAYDGAASDYFGISVSASGDVVLVGAYGDDDNGDASGSAYVFRWNGTSWRPSLKLLPDDGTAYDLFGFSVSISADVALVGAEWEGDNPFSGSAYVFRWSGTAWVQEQKLRPDDGADHAYFGSSVSVSDDVAVIGAYGDDDNGDASGSSYVFRWNGSAWVQEQKLLPDDGAIGEEFGISVSVSGDVTLVGAHLDDDKGANSGSAYMFSSGSDCNENGIPDACDIAYGTSGDLDGDGIPDICSDFCELATLLADDGGADDRFGNSVSISGDVALIGAHWDEDNGSKSGSAYVFRWNGATWVQEQKLLADDGAALDKFGFSVSVSGDVALVGASGHRDNGDVSGSAYVFRWNGSDWVQEQKILPDDGAAGDEFGYSVSVSGDVALVGAHRQDDNGDHSGSAYVFRWDGTTWVQEQKLLPDDGETDEYFGISVSVSGDVALVGAFLDDDNGFDSGSAYVFRWNGTSWVQEQKLLPDDGAFGDEFGISVSVSGDVTLVGAHLAGDNNPRSGSAYVFRWNGTAWVQAQKLVADDGAVFDFFGGSVSVSGDIALVGAYSDDDNGTDSGLAYLFRWNGTAWVQGQKFVADDGAAGDEFGGSVSVSGDMALLGVAGDDDNGWSSGSASVFSTGVTDCNQNDVFDACDIATGTSDDCEFSELGIPDECEVPQTGAVVSNWVGEFGFWDDPPDFMDWCPPESPDNNSSATFGVLIDGSTVVVVLNTSPTVSTLSLLNEAVVLVDDESGANVRTLAVDGTITNSGILRATDRERLVLDAPIIDQGGACGEGGILEAVDGILTPGEEDDKSILEINGARVLGGVARTRGNDGGPAEHSEIHLIGGAELVDVCIRGVVVPDGQIGRFSGTLTNDDALTVAGETLTTVLEPTTDNAVLGGTGRVRLTDQANAWLGDFKTAFVNSATHRIEGAGIIFGGLTNEGVIEANDADGGHLIIFPPGDKTNSGVLRADDEGTLRIEDAVAQTETGIIEATGCGTVVINATISGDNGANGSAQTCDGSIVLKPQAQVEVSSVLVAGDGEAESQIIACDGAILSVEGSLSVEDISAGSPVCDPPAGGCATRRSGAATFGGCDPPPPPPEEASAYLAVLDSATVNIGGSLSLIGAAGVSIAETAVVTLAGDFDNHGTDPDIFDWTWGSLTMDGGGADQMLEAAGEDRGADPSGLVSNFAMGALELTDQTSVNVIDAFPNQVGEPCEVLYVDRLILGAGAQLVCSCPLYFEHLSGDVAGLCPQAVQIPTGDFDGDDDVDLDDYAAFSGCFTGPGGGPIPPESGCGAFDFDLYQVQFEFAVTCVPEPRASARAELQMPSTPATEIGIL